MLFSIFKPFLRCLNSCKNTNITIYCIEIKRKYNTEANTKVFARIHLILVSCGENERLKTRFFTLQPLTCLCGDTWRIGRITQDLKLRQPADNGPPLVAKKTARDVHETFQAETVKQGFFRVQFYTKTAVVN